MPQKICLTTLVVLLAAGCGRSSPQPTLTGVVWVVSVADREAAVVRVTTMPYPYELRYKSIGEYRDFFFTSKSATRSSSSSPTARRSARAGGSRMTTWFGDRTARGSIG